MEHAKEVAMVEANFDWDDLGTWQAVARQSSADAEGNTIAGRHVGMNTTNSIIRTDDKHLIATVGVSDLIVVHTPDATLVANRHDEESVRRIVKLLEGGAGRSICSSVGLIAANELESTQIGTLKNKVDILLSLLSSVK